MVINVCPDASVRGPVNYRLETDSANPVNPRIVEDVNGVSFLAAQHQLLNHYLLAVSDNMRNAERVSREISDQIQRREFDQW